MGPLSVVPVLAQQAQSQQRQAQGSAMDVGVSWPLVPGFSLIKLKAVMR
tara:strand:- start:1 stop:147 length:147 start_codon:yes stop_codon:yes gene_type:complete